MSGTYLRGTDQRCYVVSIIPGASCQVPSFPFLKLSYFKSKDETPARRKLERKRYDTWFLEKMIYIDVGYKSATQQTDK